jgi:stress-induced morphogen
LLPRHAPPSSQISQDYLLIICTGGCGQAFSAIIVSPQFEKKTTLARHRLVNTALKTEVAAIHAWTPKCYTPEQWEKQRQEGNQAVAPGKDTTGEVVSGIKG